MSPYHHQWASELFDWMLLDPEMLALFMAAGCVLGFAVALWEFTFYLVHRARWMEVRTFAGRRRVRQDRERLRALVILGLRRRLAKMEGQHAD